MEPRLNVKLSLRYLAKIGPVAQRPAMRSSSHARSRSLRHATTHPSSIQPTMSYLLEMEWVDHDVPQPFDRPRWRATYVTTTAVSLSSWVHQMLLWEKMTAGNKERTPCQIKEWFRFKVKQFRWHVHVFYYSSSETFWNATEIISFLQRAALQALY